MLKKLFRLEEYSGNPKTWLLLLLFAIATVKAAATTDPPLVTVFDGSLNEIVENAERETYDLIYYSSNFNDIENPANDKYLNVISFFINEDSRIYIPGDFTASVLIEITWTDLNGNQQQPIQKTLAIDFKIAAGSKYNARNYFHFDNARRVTVKILDIELTGPSGWDPLQVLMLENRMEVKRDYKFLCSQSVSGLEHEIDDISPDGKFDELLVTWTLAPFKGITHFDIEWAWVDIEAQDRYKIDNNFNDALIFKNNSTRVTIPASLNRFHIPLIYDGTGYLFYRVRPLQYREDGFITEGTWSGTGMPASDYYTFVNGHEENLNWQVSTTYAEDGKRKTVIQYFDGTLRSRQTVTKDNSQNDTTTVIAETIYDYQGRPAINVLPAPTLNTVIEYVKNFNRFSLTTDAKDIFDLVPVGNTICESFTPPLDSVIGASNYYSQLNPLVNTGIHKYIPDADGFPFAETRYTPDATGRIAAQGGVGKDYQLGSGHETKYFYGSADQRELNALFGTEVGDASHYFKNMVRDANGQYSVSYVDMHGRTIATALAGTPPANLKALDSYQPQSLTKNLLANGNNIIKDRSIESATTLLVPKAGNHVFHYQLTPQSAEILACNPEGQPVCYNCYYDLEIRITGDCGQEPIIITRSNFTFGNFDAECEDPTLALVVDETIWLTEGEYNITKKLTLSKAAQDYYRDNVFSQANICKSLQDYYNEIYEALLATSTCDIDCETCNETLGDYQDFRDKFLLELEIDPNTTVDFENEIQTSYNEALANCQALCNPLRDNLKAIREQMLQDMTPDQGQYARLDKDLDDDGLIEPNEIITNKPYNIFKNFNSTSPGAAFRTPKDESDNTNFYKDEFGQKDESIHAIQSNNHSLLETIHPNDFSAMFGVNWAKSLLYYHPEYCKLKTAEQNIPDSYTWDVTFEATDTWQDALNAGYITQNILNADPFFNNPVRDDYKDLMTAEIANYRGTGKTMWQMAIISINCLNNSDPNCGSEIAAYPPYSINTCTGDWNHVWRIFRTMYQSEKDRLVNLYLDNECPGINYQELADNKYERRFGDYSSYPSDFTTILGQLQAIIDNNGDVHDAQATGDAIFQTEADKLYKETCEGYIEYWKTKLLTCDQVYYHAEKDAILAVITTGMTNVCIRGSDPDHPFGSSTVKPGDNNVPQSFEAVISSVFLQYGISLTSTCHPFLVDFPQPYDNQSPLGDDIAVEQKDECVCERITELKAEKTQVGYTGTLSQFIQFQHGVFIRQTFLDTLINGCNGVPDNCFTYDPPLTIPAILSCNTSMNNCIGCKEYNALKTQFKAIFTGFPNVIHEGQELTEEQINQNIAFANFINSRTGLNKTWPDYLVFEKQCQAYNNPWTCTQLDSIVTAFYVAYPNAGSGESCRTLFTQFFNNAFGTSLTFAGIQQLFQTYCGHLPDVCEPILDCKGFEMVIDSFYTVYGNSIDTASNCQAFFVDFFNDYFNTNYTWEDLLQLYAKLCGKELDVCSPVDCDRLQAILDSWLSCNSNAWMNSNCLTSWTAYFNSVMGTNLQEWEIAEWYRRCNIPYNPCSPPYSCKILTHLLQAYYAAGDSACTGTNCNIGVNPGDPDYCHKCFTWFINDQLGRYYTYEQIALMYLKSCGTVLKVCENYFKSETLNSFSADYIKWYADNPSAGACDSVFTAHFNQQFDVSYGFNQIMDVYLLYTGSKPDVCSKEIVLTCDQLNTIHSSFFKLYPNPKFYFGDTCQSAFTKFVNQLIGDTLSYDDISLYYGSLCGRILNVCDSTDCNSLQGFLTSYVNNYGSVQMPQQLCRDLFIHLFNQEFSAQKRYEWTDIASLYDSCNINLNICPADGDSLITTAKLLGAKKAFYALYSGVLIDDCQTVFTALFNKYFGTPFTSYQQLEAWVSDNHGFSYELCGIVAEAPTVALRTAAAPPPPASLPPRLCNTTPLFPTIVDDEGDPCDYLQTLAFNAATEQYNAYVQSQIENFDSTYKAKCLSAATQEVFTVTSDVAEYHYTLYYYDQAGNLVKTIPPAGVYPNFSNEFNMEVEAAKISGTEKTPDHIMPTQYRYNTLNQVIAQKNPDGGLSKAWHDIFGRLAVSQNAKQAVNNKYSYTKYDELGRIKETGQLIGTEVTQELTQDPTQLNNWLTAANSSREQIISTFYDLSADLCGAPAVLCQAYLRNRVSYTTFTDYATDGTYANASYFSYDIHGNIDTLLQHYFKGILQTVSGHAFKKMIYKYDLISGKVNEIAYQPGSNDQYYQRYHYNAAIKLVAVETSRDYVYWEKQAQYQYYKHGPIVRTEIGQLAVQGLDYAYNLQGWLKGINTTAVSLPSTVGTNTGYAFDMGNDGTKAIYSLGEMTSGSRTAVDALGFGLNYNINDYKSINNTVTPFAGLANGLTTLADGVITGKDLFNGNIKAVLVNIPKLSTTSNIEGVKLYGYQYDQLNRITAMNAYNGINLTTNSFTPFATEDYRERISYDPNGNILSYFRNGTTQGGGQLSMDDLTYSYVSNANKLDHVDDVATGTYSTDIDDQEVGNYDYDEIGNLTKDIAEGIATNGIEWNLYGKVSKITKTNGTIITYTYDASGNRIEKRVTPLGSGGTTTAYVRDAIGNVMSVYQNGNGELNSGHLTQTEMHIYGGGRLGIHTSDLDVEVTNWWFFSTTAMTGTSNGGYIKLLERGRIIYELSNHVGNVLVTVSDRKLAVPEYTACPPCEDPPCDPCDPVPTGMIGYFEADVVTANDYYPFGLDMPGRKYGEEGRYGFNGKERDKELNSLNAYDYGFRIYNPAIGKFLSVDPLFQSYPWYTPYQFAGNKPIRFVDRDGLEEASQEEFDKASQLISDFMRSSDYTSAWPTVTKATFGYQLSQTVWTRGGKINQGETWLCGIAAPAHLFVSRNPTLYVQRMITLYKKGYYPYTTTVSFNGSESDMEFQLKAKSDLRDVEIDEEGNNPQASGDDKLRAIDYMLLVTLRDGLNVALRCENPSVDEKGCGTPPGNIRSILDAFELTLGSVQFWREESKPDINDIKTAMENSKGVILFVNGSFGQDETAKNWKKSGDYDYKKEFYSMTGVHYIVLKSFNVTYATDGSVSGVSGTYWDYGNSGTKSFNYTIEQFRNPVKGIYILKQ